MSTAIVNIAVEGYLNIHEDKDVEFRLKKRDELTKLAVVETALVTALFSSNRRQLVMNQGVHSVFNKVIKKHRASVKRDYEAPIF